MSDDWLWINRLQQQATQLHAEAVWADYNIQQLGDKIVRLQATAADIALVVSTMAEALARSGHLDIAALAARCAAAREERSGANTPTTCALCGKVLPRKQTHETAVGAVCAQCTST